MRRWIWAFAGLSALSSMACVESGTYEKAAADLEQAHREGAQKDQQLRAAAWQYGAMEQTLRFTQQQQEGERRQLAALGARVRELELANAALEVRAKQTDAARAEALALEDDAAVKPGRGAPPRIRAEDLRRLEAAIARLERLLADRASAPPGRPGPSARPVTDILDPWSFGDRK